MTRPTTPAPDAASDDVRAPHDPDLFARLYAASNHSGDTTTLPTGDVRGVVHAMQATDERIAHLESVGEGDVAAVAPDARMPVLAPVGVHVRGLAVTPVTYAEARAACVARYGEASDAYELGGCARMWWARAWDGESDDEDGVMLVETHAGGVELAAMVGPTAVERWTLAGDGGVTPLPDALDAADAFLRTHAPQP